jgi:hypothetical protein
VRISRGCVTGKRYSWVRFFSCWRPYHCACRALTFSCYIPPARFF